jgi:hypothetical protein
LICAIIEEYSKKLTLAFGDNLDFFAENVTFEEGKNFLCRIEV